MNRRIARPLRSSSLLPGVLASGLLLAGCASGPPPGPFELWPLGPDGEPRPAEAPISWQQQGVRLELQPIAAAERGAWLDENADYEGTVVHFPAGSSLVGFSVTLAATGDLPVRLETRSLRLLADGKGGGTAPLDYTRAYELFRPDRQGPEAAMQLERFMKGIFDGAVDVPAGSTRRGMLVFPDPSAEADELVLVVPFLQVGAETHRTRLGFAKVYGSGESAAAGES